VVLLVAFILLLMSFVIVPQGYEYTLERFGRYVRTFSPGLHFMIPIVERVGARVSVMETVLDVASQDVITRDNAAVTVDGVVFFQVIDAAKSAYKVANLRQAMVNLTMTNIRTVMGSMDLDELLSNREAINARLLTIVNSAAGYWGTQVTRIEIKDITPPRDLIDSMARQMKAERDKRATILEAEGERQAEILRSEGTKRSMILQAEGRKESAERDAEARERLAQAEAVATKALSDAAKGGDAKALNYFIAQKYVEAITELAKSGNQKVLLMPLDVANLAGTVTGVAEIVKQTFSSKKEKA
jgi:regulator of protease activity HflC (stomatin/prohibitin superfamily)